MTLVKCQKVQYMILAWQEETYLLSFHFRVITRIIATNRFLHILGITDSPQCGFCNIHIENIVHLFWECEHTQAFIERVKHQVFRNFHMTLNVTKTHWFFPTLENLKQIEIIIITIAKVVIYKAKRNQQKSTLQHFLAALCLEAQKEYDHAIRYDKLRKFNDKWGQVQVARLWN